MSIVDIERNALPVDLRVKIERVMRDENLSWKETLDFLASKVVSPAVTRKADGVLFRTRGGFTRAVRGAGAAKAMSKRDRKSMEKTR